MLNTFDGADRAVRVRQYAGGTSSSTYQDTTATFDGHGRLETRHNPIEDTNEETTWSYNPDDSVSQVTDPRGVVTALTYNNLGLTTQIAYTPTGTIPDTPTVTLSYDNLGNRTSMDTAGVNKVTYVYDELSQIESETVDFDDLANDLTIAYTYHPSGKVKTVTDPFSAVVQYNEDKTAKTTSITGSGFASVSTYASGIEYTAFGAVKEMTYGTSASSVTTYTYNDRLQPATYRATNGGGYARRGDYEYFADGTAKTADNLNDGRFDQNYRFDLLGRLKGSTSGLVTNSDDEEVPAYSQIISYNAFGDVTSRSSSVWGGEPSDFTSTYVNHRKQGGDEVFDANGNVVDITTDSLNYYRWVYDASGRITNQERAYETHGGNNYDITNSVEQEADGTGQFVKRHSVRDMIHSFPQNNQHSEDLTYFVRSTVLGGEVLTEVDGDGDKVSTKVYAGGAEIAEHRAADGVVAWKHRDAVTGSISSKKSDGSQYWGGANDSDFNSELEPLGGDVPQYDPYPTGTEDPDTAPMPTRFKLNGNVFNAEMGCTFMGIQQSDPRLCTQSVAAGVGMETEFRETSTRLGYWIDEDDPNVPDVQGSEATIGTITRFIPFARVTGMVASIATEISFQPQPQTHVSCVFNINLRGTGQVSIRCRICVLAIFGGCFRAALFDG